MSFISGFLWTQKWRYAFCDDDDDDDGGGGGGDYDDYDYDYDDRELPTCWVAVSFSRCLLHEFSYQHKYRNTASFY